MNLIYNIKKDYHHKWIEIYYIPPSKDKDNHINLKDLSPLPTATSWTSNAEAATKPPSSSVMHKPSSHATTAKTSSVNPPEESANSPKVAPSKSSYDDVCILLIHQTVPFTTHHNHPSLFILSLIWMIECEMVGIESTTFTANLHLEFCDSALETEELLL